MRLDAFLSKHTLLSRREAALAIRSGRVSCGGIALHSKTQQLSEKDWCQITLDGIPIWSNPQSQVYLLHKPAGYLTATRDSSTPVVQSLLPPLLQKQGFVPVGRLDKDTTGLLLFTTDGTLHHRLLAPKWEVPKTYRFTYAGAEMDQSCIDQIENGILLSDGRTLPAKLVLFPKESSSAALQTAELTLKEGRYHQVKRMIHNLGREVLQLHRRSLGPIELASLPCGEGRWLSKEEEHQLRTLVSWFPSSTLSISSDPT